MKIFRFRFGNPKNKISGLGFGSGSQKNWFQFSIAPVWVLDLDNIVCPLFSHLRYTKNILTIKFLGENVLITGLVGLRKVVELYPSRLLFRFG